MVSASMSRYENISTVGSGGTHTNYLQITVLDRRLNITRPSRLPLRGTTMGRDSGKLRVLPKVIVLNVPPKRTNMTPTKSSRTVFCRGNFLIDPVESN